MKRRRSHRDCPIVGENIALCTGSAGFSSLIALADAIGSILILATHLPAYWGLLQRKRYGVVFHGIGALLWIWLTFFEATPHIRRSGVSCQR